MEEKWLKKKVEELLEKMTLEEKIAQLGSIQSGKLVENGKFSREKARELLKNGIGQITRVAGYAEREPEESVEIINEIQKFLKEETRLGVPAIIHEECLSGVMTKGATTFPQAIGMASTFEPSYIEKMTSIIRKEMRGFGVHQGLSPVLDIPRDPRWGRTEETFGEDPYLVSKMAESYINGLQGDDWKDGIIATAKHFTAYGISEGGRNLGPARVSERELREVFLFPFEVAVRSAKVGSIMNAYHEIDGIPCASSRFLLTKILREEWDFKGFVVSDYYAIDMLHTFHKVANSLKTAAIKALEAGIEIELPEIKCYGEPLFEAVKEGLISMSVIDTAVSRVLRAKILLGLMDDNIYADPVKINSILDNPEHRMFARELARKSMVLLKNDAILPLKKDIKSIAVIGPGADVTKNLHGDYSYTSHIAGVKDGVKTVTVLEGIKNKVSSETTVYHAAGCDLAGESKEGFKEAVDVANKSEVIIAVMGENSGLFKRGLSGEGNDRTDINLPGVQEELLKALKETGKPIVLVLLNGRPLSIKWEKENIDAIIEAWYPGEEGGNAIADVIFGDYNPAGRLPVSFPAEIGQIPVYYNRKPSAFNEYLTTNTEPLFPFGHGLSYTTFEYSDLIITPEKISSGGYVDISFKLKNTGSIAGEEVVQLYIHDEWASVERPVKELKGFIRVYIEAGKEKEVTFRLFTDQLAFYDEDMRFIVEAGIFEVMVGASSEDIRLTGKFEVTETRVITKYRKFASEVTIR